MISFSWEFSIFRVVPLMKTLTKEVLRTINLIEIIFDFIIGGVMVYVAFSGNATDNFWQALYGFLLTFFLLARGVIYFISLYYFEEKSEPMKFWAHMIFFAAGSAVLTLSILGRSTELINALVWALVAFAIGGAGYLGYDGYGGFSKYRKQSKVLNTQKQPQKQEVVEKEVPKPVEDEIKEVPKQKEEKEKEEETYVS